MGIDFGSRRDQRFQLIHTQNTIIGDGDMLDNDTPFHGLKLPRYDVGMMLHLSDDHLIASLHLRFAERLCHQVDGLRGASCKDNLLEALMNWRTFSRAASCRSVACWDR